ncbi:ribosome-recycling factor, mitochondrial-like [Salvelinus sp. IW2-2015]|uniref:ribosome-recycling factor, mitochondrial-like n=1 Tax=Salvelinus sp. IW2-2015 TaxID=2691554 RepID=UPI000CDFECB9|nr:ribosome-recycling factor, mitochondrial-like [Salvelinus alpinus]
MPGPFVEVFLSAGGQLQSPTAAPKYMSSKHRPTAATCVRLYATKMSKAKAAKGQAAKVNINSSLAEDIISLEEVKEEMAAVLTALKEDFSRNLSIKTSPGALDHIVVYMTDGKFPLNQLGQISMKPAQLIVVNMTGFPHTAGWAMAAATRALRESSMKLNPEVDRTIIRVPIPKVTREHMENRVKQFSNKSRESLRRIVVAVYLCVCVVLLHSLCCKNQEEKTDMESSEVTPKEIVDRG